MNRGEDPQGDREGEADRETSQEAGRVGRWLQENGPKIGRQGREIKSNVTDNESAIMVTSHGTIQGITGRRL